MHAIADKAKTEHTIFCGNLDGTPLQLQKHSTACLTWSFLHVEFIVRSAERRSRCRRGTAQRHPRCLAVHEDKRERAGVLHTEVIVRRALP